MNPGKLSDSKDTTSFFKNLFNAADNLAIAILDTNGTVLDINIPLTKSFGYIKEDIVGKNFSILYIESDLKKNLPEIELTTVLQKGASEDDNYVRHKDGSAIWSTGESILVQDKKEEKHIIKLIQDINEQKLLEKYLIASKEYNENIIQTVNEPLLG